MTDYEDQENNIDEEYNDNTKEEADFVHDFKYGDNNEYTVRDIDRPFYYDGVLKKTSVRYFLDENIATVTAVTESGGSMVDVGVLVEGMDREQIESWFPPLSQKMAKKTSITYNLSRLVRSIIYEAYKKEGLQLEEGNVRNFWYTHLKKIITKKLGLGETDSVLTTINNAWGDVINSGLVNYEGMNILGGKEGQRHSIVKDSPFSNLIIAVEKADYFYSFNWIPKLFNCTLITAGGQPSRTVARAFIYELSNLGVDLDQDFHMCVASDLDPAGYYIQDAFRKQFEAAIQYYGGSGTVEIRRLFVRRDQVSDTLLESVAMPCRDKANSEKAVKAEDTKWQNFCKETKGGIYVNVPPDWDGPTFEIEGEKKVRGLLEMNAFPKTVIERAIITELLKIIEDTNDESKIMIPEIMRIFEEMRLTAGEEEYKDWHQKIIQPLIDRFLSDTNRWFKDISDKQETEEREARKERNNINFPIDNEYDDLIEKQREECREREPDLHEQKESLEAQIKELEGQLDDTESEIRENCSDIFDEITRLRQESEDKQKPANDEYDAERERIKERMIYRERKLKEFRDENATVFNPVEKALRRDVAMGLGEPWAFPNNMVPSDHDLIIYFKELEQRNRFKPHIGRLLTEPEALLEEAISCFAQTAPAFEEDDLLQKASADKEENVGGVRRAFPPVFTNEMKTFLRERLADVNPDGFVVRGEVKPKDLTVELLDAMERTEAEIESGGWKEEPKDDEEDEEEKKGDDDEPEEDGDDYWSEDLTEDED